MVAAMVLVNGVPNGAVSPLDRGLAYGDGVFRTLRAQAGEPRHWQAQCAKLAFDCERIGLHPPSPTVLLADARAAAAEYDDCVVKIVVTRGPGERGYRYGESVAATRVVTSAPFAAYPERYRTHGVRVRRCKLRLGSQPALAGVKHLNRLENVLARMEWDDPEIAEGLLEDSEGNVIGGTMTNVFAAFAGGLATPALDRCGVAGVTRDRVIAGARRHGVRCEVRRFSWQELARADEIVVVNSLAGAWPVREIDGAALDVGPLARAIQTWLSEDDALSA